MAEYSEKEAADQHRQRKKKLINDVKNLLEFYFSAANLKKDAFMNKLLEEGNGYIDINIFHNFNKVKNLTNSTQILKKAIKNSEILELSEDGDKVKRSIPVELKENENECTIYVENLPANVTHDWIKKVFSYYGVIDYISLPRFHHNGQPKGFAFVEFHTPEEAQQALVAFGGLASLDGTLNPSELLSIKTYGKDSSYTPESSSTNPQTSGAINVSNPLKRTAEEAFNNGNENDDKNVAQPDNSSKGKKKKKRKRNKKEKEYELDSVYLRVMSRQNWKTLRNKYLDAQKEHMKNLKSSFQNYDLGDYYSKTLHEEFRKGGTQKFKEEGNKDTSTRPEYIPNVIVKIILNEAPTDTREFREGITNNRPSVAYIDIRQGDTMIHIRFKTAEGAKEFIDEGLYDNAQLLSGDEESCYWSRIFTLWELRRPKKKKKDDKIPQYPNLPRGRDKVVNKAIKHGSHLMKKVQLPSKYPE